MILVAAPANDRPEADCRSASVVTVQKTAFSVWFLLLSLNIKPKLTDLKRIQWTRMVEIRTRKKLLLVGEACVAILRRKKDLKQN